MSAVYTLAELARHLDGRLHGYAKHPIQGVASLSRATKSDQPILIILAYSSH